MSRTDKQALAQAMKEWAQRVVDAGVTMSNGRSYRPVLRNVSPLTYLDDPDRMVAEVISILDGGGWDSPDTGTSGWNAVIAQAGPEYVWEWLIMDRVSR